MLIVHFIYISYFAWRKYITHTIHYNMNPYISFDSHTIRKKDFFPSVFLSFSVNFLFSFLWLIYIICLFSFDFPSIHWYGILCAMVRKKLVMYYEIDIYCAGNVRVKFDDRLHRYIVHVFAHTSDNENEIKIKMNEIKANWAGQTDSSCSIKEKKKRNSYIWQLWCEQRQNDT